MNIDPPKIKKPKEFLYVGHYVDTDGNYILKVGTTNNLERRQAEHNKNYAKSKKHTAQTPFEYDWHLPLSAYNTYRYEDKTREKWKSENVGTFLPNDRFICANKPTSVEVTIRKTYTIPL